MSNIIGASHSLRRFGAALLTILTAVACTYVLNRLGLLDSMERLVLDKELAMAPHTSADIVVVNITDADYDDLFGGKSPLYPNKLHDLIDAINKSSPALIGVDIDTSHPQFSQESNFKLEDTWRNKLIWERDVSLVATDSNGSDLEPLDVLGGRDPRLNQYSGVPQLLDDPEDKVTRLYTRCVETKAGLKPSFVYAVVSAFHAWQARTPLQGMPGCPTGLQDPAQPFLIHFPLRPGTTLVFSDAAQVLGLSHLTAHGAVAANAFPQFQGKIVLLGGTYRDFDRHYTPIGPLPGVVVLANAIETELQGNPVKARSQVLLFLVEFLSGVAVALVLSTVHSPAKAFALGLAIIVGVPLALSFALFRTPSRLAIFAPTLIAVLLFEMLEHLRHKSLMSVFGRENRTGENT